MIMIHWHEEAVKAIYVTASGFHYHITIFVLEVLVGNLSLFQTSLLISVKQMTIVSSL